MSTNQINEHKFDFKLPMFPNQTVGDNGMPCELTMDGQPLKGVTALNVKAGSNGFTNVAIEFESSCAVQFVGHLEATVIDYNGLDGELIMSSIFDDAMEAVCNTHQEEPDAVIRDYGLKAELFKKLIALGIERITER